MNNRLFPPKNLQSYLGAVFYFIFPLLIAAHQNAQITKKINFTKLFRVKIIKTKDFYPIKTVMVFWYIILFTFKFAGTFIAYQLSPK